MPRISVTLPESTILWLEGKSAKKRGGKQEYIRTLLQFLENGIMVLSDKELTIGIDRSEPEWDDSKAKKKLADKAKKKSSSVIPIFKLSPKEQVNMNQELSGILKKIRIELGEETKGTITAMRKEMQNIVSADIIDAPNPP